MRLDEISVEIRDPNLARVGQLSGADFSDVLITPRSNNIGSWSVSLPDQVRQANGTDTPHALCQLLRTPGYGIIVTGPNGVILSGPTTGASHTATSSDPGGTWTITGVSDLVVLGRSESWPDPENPNPATALHANDVRTNNAETLLHQFVSQNIGPGAVTLRRNTKLTMGPNLGYGPTLTESPRYKNLLNLCQEIVVGTALQFDVLQLGDVLQFTTWVSADLTDSVRLDIDNNQLSSEQSEYSAPTATEVKVLGQGEGTARQVVTRTSTASAAAAALWHVRIERTIDQRQTDDLDELAQAGDELLAEEGTTITSFRIVPAGDLADTFEDGDWITVVINDVETTAQVTERPISITPAGVFVGATIGDPTGFDWESLVERRQDSVERRVSAIERNVEVGASSTTVGARLIATIRYTASGSFTKATYPTMTFARVKVQAAGAAGGGAATTAANFGSGGTGGGGGAYVEGDIPVASLATSETVTVGAGGTAVTGGTGNTGGTSSFGTWGVSAGGTGGTARTSNNVAAGNAAPGIGGATTTIPAGGRGRTGGDGGMMWADGRLGISGMGGDSEMAGNSAGNQTGSASSTTNGRPGKLYGGGGSGAYNSDSVSAAPGGVGGAGCVIVEVWE